LIVFKSLRYKNFLSTGNNWTEINLNKTKSTLIVGQNGAGKSTLLDALSFSLFGKPHRNINKPQLVNSINNKDCVVEVEFTVGSNEFKIVRGIKPNAFEIWTNGSMVDQSSHAKEYQKILEQNILKLNHKSFHQIIVLGSSSFIPFMQLPAQHRRDVIEDLLDINVFSKMNSILKEKNAVLRDRSKEIKYSLDLLDNKISTQKKYIDGITSLNDEFISKRNADIENIRKDISTLEKENVVCDEFVQENQSNMQTELNKANDKKQVLLQYQAQFQTKIKALVKDAKFYEQNETCPTCTQDIDSVLRDTNLAEAQSKAKELKEAMEQGSKESAIVEETIERFTNLANKIRTELSTISSNGHAIARMQTQIQSYQDELNSKQSASGDLNKANTELNDMFDNQKNINSDRYELNENMLYNSVMTEMLKDTGIKTKVIKEYLPVINNLVNKYLQVLDFFVHFDLDESFQETIRSRHRDAFSYDSFSEGEKQRIDLALLFTWRQIAKMKNSVATNLLILDETFDSSLDHDGVDNLMKILYTLDDDTNVFVISHKGEILDGKFEEKLEFYKDKNFSKLK
jgi:DNA repair exonuclease SbcCD ATPase subunit|tara:strand:+ start:2557 stop:4272 length:1716 start_codon:yes stop_codon:yes gene_type:complete